MTPPKRGLVTPLRPIDTARPGRLLPPPGVAPRNRGPAGRGPKGAGPRLQRRLGSAVAPPWLLHALLWCGRQAAPPASHPQPPIGFRPRLAPADQRPRRKHL